MTILKIFLSTSFCFFSAISWAKNEKTLPTISLQSALQSALRAHPKVTQANTDLQLRIAEALGSTTLPNPVLEAELDSIDKAFGWEIKISQPLRASYFGIRRSYAAAIRSSASAERQAVLMEVLNSALASYYSVYSLQKQAEILQKNLEETSEIGKKLEEAVLAGQAEKSSTALFQAEIARIQAQQSTLQARLTNAREQFSVSIGQPGKAWKVGDISPIPLPPISEKLEKFAIKRAPLRQALAKREELARRKLQLAEKDRFGEFSPQFIAGHNREEGTTIGVGFSIELPFYDTNKPAIQSARAELRQTQAELAFQSPQNLKKIVNLRWKAANDLANAAQTYRQKVLPNMENAYEATRHALFAGQGNVTDLWQIQKEIGNSRLEALEAESSALEARARLEEAISGRIEEAIAQ